MPTLEQIKELLDNCDSEWTMLDKVTSRRLTSKFNGNSIFLPAAGDRDGSDLKNHGFGGYYWLGTQSPDEESGACILIFYDDFTDWILDYWNDGHSVRPVAK